MAKIKGFTCVCCITLSALFCACSSPDNYTIKGDIQNAEGQMVYLDEIGFSQTPHTDSVKLKKNGCFAFTGSNKSKEPKFFRIRYAGNSLTIPIDSTETVNIKANGDTLAFANSPSAQTLDSLAEYDKEKIKRIIYSNPKSAVAVYALLLSSNDRPMFDIADKTDFQFYAMVATAYNLHHPESEYTQWLRKIVYDKKNAQRAQKNLQEALRNSTEKGAFDIALPDVNGNIKKLSDLNGKTVLLTFSYFNSDYYKEEEIALKRFYNETKNRALEIYAISFDPDYELWHAQAATLPWISVHDKRALRSVLLNTYNISTLPTYFIVSAEGDIISRHETLKEAITAAQKQAQ